MSEGMIGFDDWLKLDIRAGTINEAEIAEGTDNLMKMNVGFGDLGNRQIVSSIAPFYSPEELIGKMCPFLLNLEPKKFMGHESHGMMLALDIAGDKSDCILLHPNKEIPSGLKVV